MRRKTYNWKLFSKHDIYKTTEIADKLGFSVRTITENWKKEGLSIKNGRIKGSDLIAFLKMKKKKRKKPSEYKHDGNSFYCFATKENVVYPDRYPFSITLDKNNNLRLIANCNKNACSNKGCEKSVKNLSKIISLKNVQELKNKTIGPRTLFTPIIHISEEAKKYIKEKKGEKNE